MSSIRRILSILRGKPGAGISDSGEPATKSLVYRLLAIVFLQTVLIVLTYCATLLLWFNFTLDPRARSLLIDSLLVLLVVKLAMLCFFGLLSGWWQYVGMSDAVDILKASACSSGLFYVLSVVLRLGVPNAVIIIDMLLTVMVIGGARFAVRAYTEYAHKTYPSAKRTLVVDAGSTGSALVRELRHNCGREYVAIGVVDDDPSKMGIKIDGVRVVGTTADLKAVIARHNADCVLIASSSRSLIDTVLSSCRECKVTFKIVPTLTDRLNGSSSTVSHVRDIRVEDLLGRQPVQLDLNKIRDKLQHKVHLITGAGGSIGSELTRQLAGFNPHKLILFERSENDLFKIGLDLTEKFPKLDYLPIVGDILDVPLLRDVFATYRPHSVFHAAAYKHVPMMERNCFQAVTNNVFGTYNVALIARQFAAEDFVMISSDKAVNPTNIMGVTKRVAELLVLGLQREQTRFISVRFGNVLGSNGSVLQIFREQIDRGGPVTVTHPDAKRYFMTIPEAVQLVLQASTMGHGGEIFVLDMGEPVAILDLARHLIRLSGARPDQDVKVVFTGLRPGEKLFEELQLTTEGLKPTCHSKIRVLDGGRPNFLQVRGWLDDLSAVVQSKNIHALVTKLMAIVPEYHPSEDILALCDVGRHDLGWKYHTERARLSVLDPVEPPKAQVKRAAGM